MTSPSRHRPPRRSHHPNAPVSGGGATGRRRADADPALPAPPSSRGVRIRPGDFAARQSERPARRSPGGARRSVAVRQPPADPASPGVRPRAGGPLLAAAGPAYGAMPARLHGAHRPGSNCLCIYLDARTTPLSAQTAERYVHKEQ